MRLYFAVVFQRLSLNSSLSKKFNIQTPILVNLNPTKCPHHFSHARSAVSWRSDWRERANHYFCYESNRQKDLDGPWLHCSKWATLEQVCCVSWSALWTFEIRRATTTSMQLSAVSILVLATVATNVALLSADTTRVSKQSWWRGLVTFC